MELRHWIVRRVRGLAQRLLDVTASSADAATPQPPTDAVAAWMELVAAEAPTLIESESHDVVDPPTVAPARPPTGGASRSAPSWFRRASVAFVAVRSRRGRPAGGEPLPSTSTGWREPAGVDPSAPPRDRGRLKRLRPVSAAIEERSAPIRPRPADPAAPVRPRPRAPVAESAHPPAQRRAPANRTEPETPWAALDVAEVSSTPLRRLRFRPDDRSVAPHAPVQVDPAVPPVVDPWFAPAGAIEESRPPAWSDPSSEEPSPVDGPWAQAQPAPAVAHRATVGAVATRRGPVMLPVWPTLPPSPLDADDGGELPGAVPVVEPFGSGFEARWASERSAD